MLATILGGSGTPCCPLPERRRWLAVDLGGVMFAEGTGAFVASFPEDEQELVRSLLRSAMR